MPCPHTCGLWSLLNTVFPPPLPSASSWVHRLLGDWKPHPAALAGVAYAAAPGGRVPFGVDAGRRTARNGGRPFVMGGQLYRWAQDCSHFYGEVCACLHASVCASRLHASSARACGRMRLL